MSKKLVIGDLHRTTSDASLGAAFERFGPVTEARVVMNQDTGSSRCFGFVTFESSEDADRALEEMDGEELDGNDVRVTEAQNNRGNGRIYGGGHSRW